MNHFKLVTPFLITVCLLTGCMTPVPYTGPQPDLTLTGKAAQKEIRDFTLEDSYTNQQLNFYRMGPENIAYTLESLVPVIAKVSPEAMQKVEKAKSVEKSKAVVDAVGLTCLVASLFVADPTTRYTLLGAGVGGAIASTTLGFFIPGLLSSGAGDFNRDLKQKLSPGVAMNFRF